MDPAQDHLLPPEYVLTMRAHMLDKCPLDGYGTVARTVVEDLGAPPERLFASFEERPIASASLAQVRWVSRYRFARVTANSITKQVQSKVGACIWAGRTDRGSREATVSEHPRGSARASEAYTPNIVGWLLGSCENVMGSPSGVMRARGRRGTHPGGDPQRHARASS